MVIGELLEKWLGKVYALHTGLQQAIGNIVLFTDVEVHFADGARKAAVEPQHGIPVSNGQEILHPRSVAPSDRYASQTPFSKPLIQDPCAGRPAIQFSGSLP
jgi:hypothetical protein